MMIATDMTTMASTVANTPDLILERVERRHRCRRSAAYVPRG